MKKIQKQIKAHNHVKNKKSVTFIVGNDEFDEEDDKGYNQRKSVVSSELPSLRSPLGSLARLYKVFSSMVTSNIRRMAKELSPSTLRTTTTSKRKKN
jgi:hypothetical protein